MNIVSITPNPREYRFDAEAYDAFERIRDLASALELALEGALLREMVEPGSAASRLQFLAADIARLAYDELRRIDDERRCP